jgi:ubiquitin-conjugating enzyme E2 R
MNSSAVRALSLEYKSLQEEPVEGFRVKLLSDENLFEWSVSDGEEFPVDFLVHSFSSSPIQVGIFGPPDTLYQGGYFKVNQIGLELHKP